MSEPQDTCTGLDVVAQSNAPLLPLSICFFSRSLVPCWSLPTKQWLGVCHHWTLMTTQPHESYVALER